MLPMLRNRMEASASAPADAIERTPDEGADLDMLDAVAEDMMMAFERKDKDMLKEALSSLVAHIKSADAEQDAGLAP